ncbi:MAG TPA: ATP-binding protein [Polyangiaceae bacterium]|nr:ATP-binding protein [Polyangiaceae bacterium]
MKATSSSSEDTGKRWFVPLGTRLAVPVLILVCGVATAAYYGLSRTSRMTAMRSKEVAADMVAQLTALSVMPAVVFADEEEMRRGVADVSKNKEITDVEIWSSADPPTLLAELHQGGGRALGRPRQAARTRWLEPQSAVAVEPIVNPDGKVVGTISLRMSTEREAQALAALTSQLWHASLGSALGLALALVLVLQRMVVTPIRRLQRAAVQLKSGNSELPEALNRAGRFDDEVAQLADAFVGMAEAVRDREARLAVRNDELRVILDSVDQGFFTALPSGELLPERSAITRSWLGELPERAHVWDVVERLDASQSDWMRIAWEQMQLGVLPIDVALDQLPKRLLHVNRHFELAYHAVTPGDELGSTVIVLTEITAAVERELALAEHHEFSVLVERLVRDRRAFFDFWLEATGLVDCITSEASGEQPIVLRRAIHTLKGNARFIGLSRIATLCHRLEDTMAERAQSVLNDAERLEVRDAWNALRRRIEPFVGETEGVLISEAEYARLLELADAKTATPKLRQQLLELRYEPTKLRLERAREMLFNACQRLGKPRPEIEVLDNQLRLPPERLQPFWTVFAHLLNNAADHGVQFAEDRARLGKPENTAITLVTRLEGSALVVELTDDGYGIDWSAVAALAAQRGLPAENAEDLKRALTSDGFSLKASVTQTSGRGVGMAAVHAVVQSLGGKLDVESAPQRGTCWRVTFPPASLSVEHATDSSDATRGQLHGRWPKKEAI